MYSYIEPIHVLQSNENTQICCLFYDFKVRLLSNHKISNPCKIISKGECKFIYIYILKSFFFYLCRYSGVEVGVWNTYKWKITHTLFYILKKNKSLQENTSTNMDI